MSVRNPGGSGVTLLDVAREAGVHVSTVSRALDPAHHARVKDATRIHIEAVADKLGYRPDMVARGLKSGRTAAVGVIVADLGNTFVTPVIHGLTAAVETAGMMPMIAETEDNHDRFSNILDHMLSRRVDAMVVTSARLADREILESAGRIVPIVVAGRPLDDTSLPQVIVDEAAGGRLVAEHFAELGHRQVAQLRGPVDVANFPRRSAGFSAACAAAGVEEVHVQEAATLPIIDEGRRIMQALIDQARRLPSAIFAQNDLMALGALSLLRDNGIVVPDDVSLAGYNNLPTVGHVSPGLTTVNYPSMDVGRLAGEMILNLLAGESVENVVLEPALVVRQSTQAKA
ncbi:MAG: LacI family transcriptional regulator [Acidimicrobiia bacterium]|nr:LacI family transcriptional regulator [Acidimicrobiia bacterium]